MCFFIDDDDDDAGTESSSSNTGRPKFQLRNHHTWLIPRRVLMIILALAIMMIFFGIIMMAIGGGIDSVGLRAVGGVLLGLGILALIICLLVCLYAYFFYGTMDQSTQTTDIPWSDDYTQETPGYASIGRPSALKSPDSTLKRNGILGPKKVTMAPELGQYGEIPVCSAAGVHSSSDAIDSSQGAQISNTANMGHSRNMSTSMGVGQGGASLGSGQGGMNTSVSMGAGQGGMNAPDSMIMAQGGMNANDSMIMAQGAMNSSGSMAVGQGGITPTGFSGMGQGQSLRSASHSMSVSSSTSPSFSGGNVYIDEGSGGGTLSRGGVSMVSSGTLPRSAGGSIDGSSVGTGGIRITPLDGSQPFPSPGSSISYGGSTGQYQSFTGGGSSVSGSIETYAYPKSVLHSSPGMPIYDGSGSVSQYSTLRSIPVTHIISDPQKQQQLQQQQQQHQQQQYREEAVEYARVTKPAKNIQQTVRMDLPQQGIIASQGQAQFQRRHRDDDFDYDNPVERTPMIPHQQNLSYHEQQMQFQRHHRQQQQQQQQQQDLHAPRHINTYSLQRQTAANPFHFNQHSQQQQQHQYQTIHEQQHQKQQQCNVSNSTSTRNSFVDDLPPPQPLVYPSARRPMTFEQVSSSKMSVYDNVLANNLRGDEEEEE